MELLFVTSVTNLYNVRAHKHGKPLPVSKWEAPPSGRLKINFDGAFRAELNTGGIGVIVRDDHGHCLAALHRSIKYASSAFQVEVEACRAGMLFALEKGFNDFILETDCSFGFCTC